jgi:hypothetical protein
MDRQYIRDAQVIERYLQGKLSGAEEEAFEEAYLADSELLAELKAADRLREGLQDFYATERPPQAAPRSGWRELVASTRYGIAASLVAAAALTSSGLLYMQNRGLEGGSESQLVAASNMRLLPLVSVRGANDANVIAAPAAEEWVVLLLDAGFTDYDHYRATVVRRDADETLLRVDEMTPTYEGLLALGMPGRALAPGDYEVRLEGGRRDWPADRALDELTRTPLTVEAAP